MPTDPQIATPDGIEKLFDLYADDIFRYALYSLGNRADAKDVVQEVFLRAYEAREKFRGEAQIKTWLLQIARNYIYDLFRRKRTQTNYLKNNLPEEQVIYNPPDDQMDLKNGIAALKKDFRQVITLRFIEDLSIEDAAQILGWSQAKVRTTQHRALKQLRNMMDEKTQMANPIWRGR